MTVTKIYTDGKIIDVSSLDYSSQVRDHPTLKQLLTIGALCNNAEYRDGEIVGDPTEAAILAASIKGGIKENLIGFSRIGNTL